MHRQTELLLKLVDHAAFESAMELVQSSSGPCTNLPATPPQPQVLLLPSPSSTAPSPARPTPAPHVPTRLSIPQQVMLCCDACHVRKVHLFNPSGIKWHQDPLFTDQGLCGAQLIDTELTALLHAHSIKGLTMLCVWWPAACRYRNAALRVPVPSMRCRVSCRRPADCTLN